MQSHAAFMVALLFSILFYGMGGGVLFGFCFVGQVRRGPLLFSLGWLQSHNDPPALAPDVLG